MKRLTAAVLCLGLVGVLPAGDDEASKKALRELEGEYTVKSLERGGKPAPEKETTKVKGVTIKDGVITINLEKKDEPAKIKVDPTKKPAHIDIIPVRNGKEGKEVIQGIYKLENGVLTLVFDEKQRPTDFKTEGSESTMMVLARKDAKK